MFNVGGGEFLVIALVALIVLGPDKLPEVARKVGNVMAEVRAMSNGFRREMRDAMEDPIDVALRDRDGTPRASSGGPGRAAAPPSTNTNANANDGGNGNASGGNASGGQDGADGTGNAGGNGGGGAGGNGGGGADPTTGTTADTDRGRAAGEADEQ